MRGAPMDVLSESVEVGVPRQRAAPPPVLSDPSAHGEAYSREVVKGQVVNSLAFDAPQGALTYRVQEPTLQEEEARAREELQRTLPGLLPPIPRGADRATLERVLRETVADYLRLHYPHLSPDARERVHYYRVRDALGLGPIDALLRDPEVEDVSCDGPGVPVFVYHARFESLRTNVRFADEETLRGFVVHLAQRCGRGISVAHPLLDGVTAEGHRVQATYGHEVTSRGSGFTIRRFRDRPFTPVDLIVTGTASAELVAYLWLAVEQGDPLIICGGPGAGKTSTLNALAVFIPPTAKVVSIEDTRELNLLHEHWVPATTRAGTGPRGSDGKTSGEVDMYDLLTAALRQRPSHILVGEVRGTEAVTMFQAMATGHATYATMHADSVRAMVSRLEGPPIRVPRALFGSLKHVLIEVQHRTPTGSMRKLAQLVEVAGLDPETGEIVTAPVFEWDANTDTFHYQGHSLLVDRVAAQRGTTVREVDMDLERRTSFLQFMAAEGVTDPGSIRARLGLFVVGWVGGSRGGSGGPFGRSGE